MALYESVIIGRQDLTTSQFETIVNEFISVIESLKGTILKKESWGLRNLAYKINKNRNSKEFLDFALKKLRTKNFKINNIDLMIVSVIPKINPYYEKLLIRLIKLLQIDKNQITIKATTNEKSGLIGKSEFIACWSNLSIC